MRLSYSMFAAAALMLCGAVCFAQEPPKEKSLEERCEEEADRLTNALDLEYWQTFYVDSTLKHDYAELQKEYDLLQKAKVSNYSLYQDKQDFWMDRIDLAYQKIFTEEQWALYLKQGAAKAQKAREKRRLKAQQAVNPSEGKSKK